MRVNVFRYWKPNGGGAIERHVFIKQEKRILDDIEEPRNVFKGDTEKVQVTLKIAASSFFSLFFKRGQSSELW